MNNITMIKVEQLYHHPENPRKDLGDISELTESIKSSRASLGTGNPTTLE